MRTLKPLKNLWKSITQTPHPVAVLVFAHGLEHFTVRTETPEQEAQLRQLLADYAANLMGVYDHTITLDEMYDDFRLTTEKLLDSDQKTD